MPGDVSRPGHSPYPVPQSGQLGHGPEHASTSHSMSPPPVSIETGGPASRTRSRALPNRSSTIQVATTPLIPKKRKSIFGLVLGSRKIAKQDDAPPPEFNHVHSRILMCKGREIYQLQLTQELLLSLHDAIEGHRSLYEARVLHRDV